MATTFPSARDGWLVVVLTGSVVLSVGVAVVLFRRPGLSWIAPVVAVALLLAAALAVWGLIGTSYELSDATLVARSGPLRWRVPLDAIESVVPSRSLESAPALSLDRLWLRTRGTTGGLLVSPRDRAGFLEALLARAPHLRRDGDRLVGRD